MGTIRHPKIPGAPEGTCRGCGAVVYKPRRNWCSQKCVDEALIRSNAGAARRAVLARDGGVCSDCALNTSELEAKYEEALRMDRDSASGYCVVCDITIKADRSSFMIIIRGEARGVCPRCGRQPILRIGYEHRAIVFELLEKLRYTAKFIERLRREPFSAPHFWEADHIVPVVEGGGGCGLDNLRTLCIPCHRLYTAALAKRSVHRRKMERKYEKLP